MPRARGRRGFGWVRKLPSKRWQASYIGPDELRHNAPAAFTTNGDAEGWLSEEGRLVAADDWRAPAERAGLRAPARKAFGWAARRPCRARSPRCQGLLECPDHCCDPIVAPQFVA